MEMGRVAAYCNGIGLVGKLRTHTRVAAVKGPYANHCTNLKGGEGEREGGRHRLD